MSLQKVSFVCLLVILMACVTNAEELYQKYQPQNTTRSRESTQWSISYSYNSCDTKTPRVLLIGDSICNGYQSAVIKLLKEKMNVTYWVSSRCVTERDYFRELNLVLGARDYNIISFNNGLHSFGTNLAEWETAYQGAVQFIKAKCPNAKLFICNCTPLKDPAYTAKSKQLNAITQRIAEKEHCPVIDLFSLMDPLDRNEYWKDACHFKQPATEKQAQKIVETILAP